MKKISMGFGIIAGTMKHTYECHHQTNLGAVSISFCGRVDPSALRHNKEIRTRALTGPVSPDFSFKASSEPS